MIPSIFDYLPDRAEQIMKIAEQRKEGPLSRKMKIVGKGMLGFGVGTGLGIGAGALADKMYQRSKGVPVPQSRLMQIAPFVTGAMGMAYGIHKALEQEELQRVSED